MNGETPTTEPKPAADVLAARSGLYAVLARALSHPDAGVLEFLRDCAGRGAEGDDEITSRLGAVLARAGSATEDELQSAYMSLFGPMAPHVPYGIEQRKLQDFRKAQRMADVMGFYRAFGVEPHGDRPDHLAAELEFMHLLALKERHALLAGRAERAALCRDAQVKFFAEHLEPWAGAFARSVRAAMDGEKAPFYAAVMELLESFMESEKEALR